jgi:hypothetical protein
VLSLLHQNVVRLAGDADGQEVCLDLTRQASRPYLESLDTWLLCGVIEDPYDEVCELKLFNSEYLEYSSFRFNTNYTLELALQK